MRRDADKGRILVFQENENIVHILLKYIETQRWRKPLLDDIWLHINEKILYKNINFIKTIKLKKKHMQILIESKKQEGKIDEKGARSRINERGGIVGRNVLP